MDFLYLTGSLTRLRGYFSPIWSVRGPSMDEISMQYLALVLSRMKGCQQTDTTSTVWTYSELCNCQLLKRYISYEWNSFIFSRFHHHIITVWSHLILTLDKGRNDQLRKAHVSYPTMAQTFPHCILLVIKVLLWTDLGRVAMAEK